MNTPEAVSYHLHAPTGDSPITPFHHNNLELCPRPLICISCARSLPMADVFRTGCWTGTGNMKYIVRHSTPQPQKPTGSRYFDTGLSAFQARPKEFYFSDNGYFEEESPGEYRAWLSDSRYSGIIELRGVDDSISNTTKFVCPTIETKRHGMLVPFSSLPIGTCSECGKLLPTHNSSPAVMQESWCLAR